MLQSSTNLEQDVRAALKQKWMNDDHDLDMEKMAEYFGATKEVLDGIITQYESELIATKFNRK